MFSPFAETLVLERTELHTADNANSCEDCPDINPSPPPSSDCPHFDVMNSEPICTREDVVQRQIESWLKSGIGSSACLDLVHIAETGNWLS